MRSGRPQGRSRLAAAIAILALVLHIAMPVPWHHAPQAADRLAADLAAHCAPGDAADPAPSRDRQADRPHCPLCLGQNLAGVVLPPGALPLPGASWVRIISLSPAGPLFAAEPDRSPHNPRAPPFLG